MTGATVLLKGDCVMRATQVGADTVLSQIAAMVARAQATKAPVQQLADKIARYFVPAVMIIAIWTFAIWRHWARRRNWRTRWSPRSVC